MRKLIPTAGAIAVLVAGCSDESAPRRSGSTVPTARAAADPRKSVHAPPREQPVPTPIPKDVNYTIIDQNAVPGIERRIDVDLNRRVSEDVLKSIAIALKNSDAIFYERTFIGFYLPDMAGRWATGQFSPNLEVRIIGPKAGP
jgi:hypothetical protein